MKLNEAEMRMAYQIESTDPNAVLNEIYMTWRLSRNQATRDTAESLMAKLRTPVKQRVHGFDPGGPGKLPSAGEAPDHRGNAGGGQTEVRGTEAGRTRYHGPGTV